MKNVYIEPLKIADETYVLITKNGEKITIKGDLSLTIDKIIELADFKNSNVYLDTLGFSEYLGDIFDRKNLKYKKLKFRRAI